MSTTDLEKQNLEAHVDLCAERYSSLDAKIDRLEARMKDVEITLLDILDKLHKMENKHQDKWNNLGGALIIVLVSVIGFLIVNGGI